MRFEAWCDFCLFRTWNRAEWDFHKEAHYNGKHPENNRGMNFCRFCSFASWDRTAFLDHINMDHHKEYAHKIGRTCPCRNCNDISSHRSTEAPSQRKDKRKASTSSSSTVDGPSCSGEPSQKMPRLASRNQVFVAITWKAYQKFIWIDLEKKRERHWL